MGRGEIDEAQKIYTLSTLLLSLIHICHGVHPDHATEQFRATGLTGAEAKLLSLSPGEPAINLRRITWAGNTLVEYCNSIVRGDFFTYTVELK